MKTEKHTQKTSVFSLKPLTIGKKKNTNTEAIYNITTIILLKTLFFLNGKMFIFKMLILKMLNRNALIQPY